MTRLGMSTARSRRLIQASSLVLLLGLALVQASQRRNESAEAGYLAGTVRSPRGPEAGVWVIAESDALPTKLV